MPEVFISKEMIEASINNTLQKELDKAVENLKRTLPKIQLEIRKESFQSFKLVTGIIIEQEFVKVYGHSFDLSSLQHSLIYIQSKDTLDVKIDYNSNVFRFNDNYFNEQNKFNQNARRWERKNRKYLNPNFYTDSGSFADFYDAQDFSDYIDTNITSEDDYLDEISMDYDDLTFNSKRNLSFKTNLNSTYSQAINKAQLGFKQEWRRSIRNRLEKKYGIKLI